MGFVVLMSSQTVAIGNGRHPIQTG